MSDWTVATDHPVFEGHFPGQPIVPGVLLLDFALREIALAHGSPVRAWRIASAKFLRPVGPGATLQCRLADAAGAYLFEIHGDSALVASGRVEALA